MDNKKVKKLMTFSETLYRQVERRANAIGMPFQEYVRHVLASDLGRDFYIGPTEYIDDETAKEIKKGMDDIKAGRYTTIKAGDKEALRKFLNS